MTDRLWPSVIRLPITEATSGISIVVGPFLSTTLHRGLSVSMVAPWGPTLDWFNSGSCVAASPLLTTPTGTAVPSAHNGDLHRLEPPKSLTPKPFQHPHCPPGHTLLTFDLSPEHNNKANRDPPYPSPKLRRKKERSMSKIPNPPRKSAWTTLSLLTAHPDPGDLGSSPRGYTE